MRRRWTTVSLIVATAAASVITAVYPTTSHRAEERSTRERQERLRAVENWTMPLSSYWRKADSTFDTYAEGLLISRCMRESGIHYEPAPPRWAGSPLVWNPDLRRLFNERVARRLGYQTVEPGEKVSGPSGEVAAQHSGQWEKCTDRVRRQHPLPPYNGVMQRIEMAADAAAREDPQVLSAATRWRDCMASRGVENPPARPEEMYAPHVRKSLVFDLHTTEIGKGVPDMQTALWDARCRMSSGYASILHRTEWQLQEAGIGEHLPEVRRESEIFRNYHRDMTGIAAAETKSPRGTATYRTMRDNG